MKKILLFTLLFANLLCYAQLDREHWFGPMVDRLSSYSGIPNSDNQAIYMSTGESIPFKVDVYFDNAVIATYTISKNNPQKHIISSANREQIIVTPGSSTPMNGLFKPVKMGFYLKGEKPFFASLRFSTFNHGEIVTSKGTAALGTEFRSVTAPLLAWTDLYNSMSSVMATENNTKVTISEFKPDIIFWDDIPRTEITFELNKGESYIVEVNDVWYENHTGYIGAKIVSDKPVIVTNGNFNGQYVSHNVGSDILMDQAVPVNKLGKNFVLVKGNGENSFVRFGNIFTMEKALIVASKNSTKIYLNGNTTPVATLNAGEFFTTPPNSYIDQGSNHYNMFIESSEDIYVYQLLAGQAGQISEATGGMNYIPPLSCYLPKKIDEIGLIDENLFFSNSNPSGRTSVPTKLNVITEKGAVVDVKRNGTSLPITAANGPHNVSGNSTWQTYSFPDITGNIAVFSTKAVTAGLSAGDDAVGYGGYFAGFSAIPLITKTEGDCLPGVKIEVTAAFDSYKWYNKDDPSTVLSTNHYYYPTKAGIYYVKIQTGSCPEIQTEDFKFFNCTTYTNVDYETCTVQQIIPKFALSTQSINPTTIKITDAPTKGTIPTNTDGTIILDSSGNFIYTANPNATGVDTFKFSFCGIGAIPDCEEIQATIKLNQIEHYDVDLNQCSNNNSSIFNLKNAAVTPDLVAQKVYYYDSALLNPIPNNLIENFPGTDGDSVYVHLKNAFGCEATATIKLKITNYLILDHDLHQIPQCDNDLNNTENIKLDLYQTFFTTDSNVSVKYFDDPIKAQNNLPGEDIGASQDISGDRTFYYRFTKTGFCDVIGKLMIDFKQPKKSLILEDKEICPDPNVKATLEVEADFDGNVIWSTGETSTSIKVGVGEHYADLTFDGCTYRQKVSVTAVALPTIVNVEIKGSTVTVNAIGGTSPYQYAIDNSNYQTSNVFLNVSSGEHTIYVISADHCIPVSTVIYVIQIYNVITPNNDGINDVLNYSDLLKKEDPFLQIFDRMGNTVFRGDKNNLYSWDGKSFGKTVATGSYWYIMKWKEPGFSSFTEYSGWILVKNRE